MKNPSFSQFGVLWELLSSIFVELLNRFEILFLATQLDTMSRLVAKKYNAILE